jgi:hypothetical protein
MPIEIRELVIRTRIEPGAEPNAGPATGQPSLSETPRGADAQMIRACVQEVLRVLEERRER